MTERSWRQLATVAGVVALYGLGSKIPLPGIDIVSAATMLSHDFVARLSVVGLGLTPFLSVLICFEIAKLLLPPFARWQVASPYNADGILRVLTVILAVLQGYGVCNALQHAGLLAQDGSVFAAAIASLVAGTLLLVWLADRIVLPGLGNGFWLLWVAPFVGSFLGGVVLVLVRADSSDILISAVYVLLASAAVVVANLAIAGGVFRSANSDEAPSVAIQALIWPPLLANLVAGYLAALPSLVWPFSLQRFLVVRLICLVPLIAVFVFAYMRKQPETGRTHKMSWLLLCFLELAIVIGGEMLSNILPWQLNGGLLIITVTVMMSLLRLMPLRLAQARPTTKSV